MTANPFSVRRASPSDIDSLLLFAPQVMGETTILPLSQEKVEYWVDRCCHQKSGAIAGIIDGIDGQIDASVGLAFVESEVSDVPYVMAIWCGLHPTIRKHPGDEASPKAHYGRRLFEFSRWCHENLETIAGHPILARFDVLTRAYLGPKMRLYQRNLTQVGACFAFGVPAAEFKPQDHASVSQGVPT